VIGLRIERHPILEFKKGRKIKFYYEGKELYGYEGESIASALHANGIMVLRESLKLKRKRGFFCAIGKCSSCTMEVDGKPNVRVCITPLKEGMVIKMQSGKGDVFAGACN